MYKQIIKALPKSAWQDIVIHENNEQLVEVLETDLLLHGSQFGPWESNNSYYLRETVANMLRKASEMLPSGYRLAIVEGVRSIEKQQEHWNRKFQHFSADHPEWSQEKVEHQTALVVARPAPLANHNCGGAVDVALVYNNELVDMGSRPQAFTEKRLVEMFSELITDEQKQNRTILRESMESVGFVWYPGEWWHYCYGDRMWAVYTGQKECIYGPIQDIK
jgi:D-alanyl-D-alanine dipeptidase